MNNVTRIVKKVRQAPWRVQRQWIGLFLLGLVLVAMVAAIYLNITVRTAIAGREIQVLQIKIADNQRSNADLESQLASLTSAGAMQSRAEILGFRPARPEDITYVVVPGYTRRTAVDMSIPGRTSVNAPVLLPDYTESLFDWFTRKLAVSSPAGTRP